MGSLMAGWDSPVLGDDTKGKLYASTRFSCCLQPWMYFCCSSREKTNCMHAARMRNKAARRMRSRSLTKEEVEAFWRQQGKPAPEDGVTSPLASPRPTMVCTTTAKTGGLLKETCQSNI
jgi:hypothetical protein